MRATIRSVWQTDQSAVLNLEQRFSTVLYYQNFTEAEKLYESIIDKNHHLIDVT